MFKNMGLNKMGRAYIDGVAIEVTEEEIAATRVGMDMNIIVRDMRNNLLSSTDTWGLADYPATTAQTAYRQALRDITSQAGFPNEVVWPTKPEV